MIKPKDDSLRSPGSTLKLTGVGTQAPASPFLKHGSQATATDIPREGTQPQDANVSDNRAESECALATELNLNAHKPGQIHCQIDSFHRKVVFIKKEGNHPPSLPRDSWTLTTGEIT